MADADQLTTAGATETRLQSTPQHDWYSIGLADPEGNEFCLV